MELVCLTLFLLISLSAASVKPSSFAASEDISVSRLQSAVTKASKIASLASYPVSIGADADTPLSTIYSDWASFKEGAAFVWIADMDLDCDGLHYTCEGNRDGQPLTNWGALSAYDVPFIVIPDIFLSANQDLLPGNNVAAVICNSKIYYAILGDTNNNDPQVTGEASWLLANTCFPNDNLNGNRGHTPSDVTYIVFTGRDAVLPETALNENYITDFSKLRSMGDSLMTSLIQNLGMQTEAPTPSDEPGSESPGPASSPGPSDSSEPSQPSDPSEPSEPPRPSEHSYPPDTPTSSHPFSPADSSGSNPSDSPDSSESPDSPDSSESAHMPCPTWSILALGMVAVFITCGIY